MNQKIGIERACKDTRQQSGNCNRYRLEHYHLSNLAAQASNRPHKPPLRGLDTESISNARTVSRHEIARDQHAFALRHQLARPILIAFLKDPLHASKPSLHL